MYWQILSCVVALLGLAHAQHPGVTAPPGPQPTPFRGRYAKRQDNVKKNIEIHRAYAAPIGVDTQYLTMEGSSTKWIGVNTEYLTEVTRTSTVDNVETTTVVKAQLAVVTATEASEGVEVGDVTVLMSDAVQNELDSVVKVAAASCNAGAKLRKRQSDFIGCVVESLADMAQDEGILSSIIEDLNSFVLGITEVSPENLVLAFEVLKSQAQRNKFLLMFGAALTTLVLPEAPDAEVAHKLVFSDGLFRYPAEDPNGEDGEDDKNDGDDASPTEKLTATPSTSSCDPSATVDENSPACDDPDCEGKEKVCQLEGEKKSCPCVMWVEKTSYGLIDRGWSDEQQKIFQELEAGLPDVIPPKCVYNNYGDAFDGKPKAEPSAFCHCWSKKDGGGETKGNFPTMSGEGDKACPYTTMPTETISITTKPRPTDAEVTSCRRESRFGEEYCTCNDDMIHGDIVTTLGDKETTVCPDEAATMTQPIGEPSCYPTHGPPHDNPENDELIKLCKAGKPEFHHACQTTMNKERGFLTGCPGKSSALDHGHPLKNNHFNIYFEPADNAPDDCGYVFYQNTSDEKDKANAQIDRLCIPVIEAIRDKCTWNGGEARNECGTFKYQSCKLGMPCKWGRPGL